MGEIVEINYRATLQEIPQISLFEQGPQLKLIVHLYVKKDKHTSVFQN